jgi:hypothetical protein
MENLAEQGAKIRADKYHQRTAGVKILLGAGVIKKAKVLDGISDGFSVAFEAAGYEKDIALMHGKKPEIKHFKTIEAAIQFCRRELDMRGGIEVLA